MESCNPNANTVTLDDLKKQLKERIEKVQSANEGPPEFLQLFINRFLEEVRKNWCPEGQTDQLPLDFWEKAGRIGTNAGVLKGLMSLAYETGFNKAVELIFTYIKPNENTNNSGHSSENIKS
jgi:hypothetical protein